MLLHQLTVDRFRGIKRLDWKVDGSLVCLIGLGDSTKTTILEAIELALSPHWNVTLDDADFFGASTGEDIVIQVVVGNLPEELKSEAKYGLATRGWSRTVGLHDEPQDGDELVLSIEFRLGASLEPSWKVVNDRLPEGKPIGAKDREKLGCVRLGDYLDRHFAWGRGSSLSRLTETGDSISSILADANRGVRGKLANLGEADLPKLHAATDKVREAAQRHGVSAKDQYRPNLDARATSIGEGGLSLHDGDVPVRKAGLGTRRLLAIAMQREVTDAGCLSLVDEIEHGLEPHRIRNMLRILKHPATANESKSVIMTTHAPVVLEELEAIDLQIVRSVNGVTTVTKIPYSLQPIVRKQSAAFLARKVLVCEGKTELGFCRGLDLLWGSTGASFALAGVGLVFGNGSECAKNAIAFLKLGYDTMLIGDSDTPFTPSRETLIETGGNVLLWAGDVSFEQRVAFDLPLTGVVELVKQAVEYSDEANVRAAFRERLAGREDLVEGHPDSWPWQSAEAILRTAFGLAAKSRTWFKRVDRAERLTSIVVAHAHLIEDTDLARKTEALRVWAHGHG